MLSFNLCQIGVEDYDQLGFLHEEIEREEEERSSGDCDTGK